MNFVNCPVSVWPANILRGPKFFNRSLIAKLQKTHEEKFGRLPGRVGVGTVTEQLAPIVACI